MFEKGEKVGGVIFNKVKGGFTVDLDGAVAFLPGSQVDIRPVRDIGPLMHQTQQFQILKMDRRRGNIVVSRRSVLEETRAEQRADIVARLEEGQVIDGLVKNITDYGAFIDLGGIDGLLHVTDMAWRRVNHPSEILNVGDTVKVQIIRINPETQRISLGMKQLQADPWQSIETKYPVGDARAGHRHQHRRLRRLRGAGAGRRGPDPRLRDELDQEERASRQDRLDEPAGRGASPRGRFQQAAHLARPQADAGEPLGSPSSPRIPRDRRSKGPIRNITEFGLFVGLDGGVDGMVHLSDLDWTRAGDEVIKDFKKGDTVKAVVLDVDSQKERISLGIKQLSGDPIDALGKFKKGDTVTCTVVAVQENGIEVKIADSDLVAFVKRSDLSRDRSEQRPDRFNVGDKVDAAVTSMDKAARRITVSVKALEIAEEKQAVAQYGSSDSGASLGDIFKAAIKKRETAGSDGDADADAEADGDESADGEEPEKKE